MERSRQPLLPIGSLTDTVLVLPPIWKMAEPALPGAPTTPTSRGSGPGGWLVRVGAAAAASFGLTGTRRIGALRWGRGSSPSCSIQGSWGGGGGRSFSAEAAAWL